MEAEGVSAVRVKGDLDLLYLQPFIQASMASILQKHLLAELPWYKVWVPRSGNDKKHVLLKYY